MAPYNLHSTARGGYTDIMGRDNSVPEYSVVVPVYESASCVERLVERTTAVFQQRLKASCEIILVDDGSRRPETWDTLLALATADARVKAIRLMRNYGKPAAVLCGLAHTRGNWVVTIDDDLQQRPEDIAELVKFRDHDVVVATYSNRQHRLDLRLAGSLKGVFDHYILHLPFRMSPLKLIKRQVVDEMLRIQTVRPYIPALLAHITADFKPVALEHRPSQAGKSRYTTLRRLRQFSNLVISNSGIFLRATALFGASVLAMGFGLAIYHLSTWLGSGAAVAGWNILIVINLVLGGFVMMGLGFVGEYLVRIVELGSTKPPYIVRETITGTESENRNTVERVASGAGR